LLKKAITLGVNKRKQIFLEAKSDLYIGGEMIKKSTIP
jgi:hypothetical protein